MSTKSKTKVKQSHYWSGQALRIPGVWGSQISRQPAHEGDKVVSPTHRPPLPPGNIRGTHFSYRLSRPQGRSVAGRITSIKNSNDAMRNRTRDLPTCGAVPQPTVPLRAPPEGENVLRKRLYTALFRTLFNITVTRKCFSLINTDCNAVYIYLYLTSD